MSNPITITINDHKERDGYTVKPTEVNFKLFYTTAPKSYDHGSTIRFENFGKTDNGYVVLVRSDAWEWSRGRYGSGMYAFVEIEDEWIRDAALEELWTRLYAS